MGSPGVPKDREHRFEAKHKSANDRGRLCKEDLLPRVPDPRRLQVVVDAGLRHAADSRFLHLVPRRDRWTP
jgi:hypothetical protein